MDSYNDKENEMFIFGGKSGASQKLQSRAHNISSGKQGRPPDEMMGNHLHDSVELKLAMEGFVCDVERTQEKTLMEGDSQIFKEHMVVEDAWNDRGGLVRLNLSVIIFVGGINPNGGGANSSLVELRLLHHLLW